MHIYNNFGGDENWDWSGRPWHHFRGGWGGGPRRGDMRPIILSVLLQKPMHGYEIIRHLEDKSYGFWRPSPGSIYPTLQMLEEEGSVKAEERGDKKVYALTEEGKQEAQKTDFKSPWEYHHPNIARMRSLFKFLPQIAPLIRQIAKSGSEEQIEAVAKALEELKTKLEQIANNTN